MRMPMTTTTCARHLRRPVADGTSSVPDAFRAVEALSEPTHRRLRLAVLVILFPVGLAVLGVRTVQRQHRRFGSWWRTIALVGTWVACAGCVVLVLRGGTLALLGILGLFLGWGADRAVRWWAMRAARRYADEHTVTIDAVAGPAVRDPSA